jgi:hypothetical protein
MTEAITFDLVTWDGARANPSGVASFDDKPNKTLERFMDLFDGVATEGVAPGDGADPVDVREQYDGLLAEVHGFALARCGDRALAEDVTQEALAAAVTAWGLGARCFRRTVSRDGGA